MNGEDDNRCLNARILNDQLWSFRQALICCFADADADTDVLCPAPRSLFRPPSCMRRSRRLVPFRNGSEFRTCVLRVWPAPFETADLHERGPSSDKRIEGEKAGLADCVVRLIRDRF